MELIGPGQEELKENLEEINIAAYRARDLVKQILAFSYQAENDLKPIQIHFIVKEALKLLKATIPSTIEIKTDIDPECGTVLADPTQIHQIVMNLCTNAYQAIEGGHGFIKVSLSRVEFQEESMVGFESLKGKYVLLTVFNTGRQIEQEHMDRIFEPFFTTKEKGKGTGLGLSVVFNIVKSYAGTITVKSEAGEGTVFSIFLPLMEGVIDQDDKNTRTISVESSKGERIMIVDDDPTITALEKKVLKNLGYIIDDFTESPEAFAAFSKDPGAYDLVVTDYTMPGMTGEALAREIISVRNDIPIILITGFSGKFNQENARKIGIREFVTKPVIMNNLARTIRTVLDEPPEAAGS
jgi:CheY-like chemotaxis protein